MNAGTTPGISSEEKGAAWRAILIFLILTIESASAQEAGGTTITLAPLMLVWFGFADFPKILLTALGLTLLAGCAVGPDYQRPATESPDAFRRAAFTQREEAWRRASPWVL